MILRRLEAHHDGDDVVLAAEVEPERPGLPASRVWLAVARDYEEHVDRSATPFVPSALVMATALGEDLRIEGPVSERIVRGAEQASLMYRDWWGYRAARVDAAGGISPAPEPGSAVGLFYSRGVDSTTTLLRSLDGLIEERVTHLLSFRGLSRRFSAATDERIWADTVRAAAEYGLPLIRLATNTDEVVRRHIAWGEIFGAIIAGGALAVGPLVREMLFGATVDDDAPRARGSHPDLDRLWSTETTSFRQDGTELGKTGRIEFVSRHPIALRHLKTCWEADAPGNCGRCFKCVKTMTTFAAAGNPGWEDAFDTRLTPELVVACRVPVADAKKIPQQVLGKLPPELAQIEAAWAENLERTMKRDAREQRRRSARQRVRRLRRAPRRGATRARRLGKRGRRGLRRTRVRIRRSFRRARRVAGSALGR